MVLLTVAVLVAGAGGALVWRLAQGPISLRALVPVLERQANVPGRPFRVVLDDLVLSWADGDDGGSLLDLRALRVRAVATGGDDAGRTLGEVPEVRIAFSLPALLGGRLQPTRLELVRPALTIVRNTDLTYGFDLAPAGTQAPPAGTAPESGTGLVGDLLASLRQPPDPTRPLGLLNTLTVAGADLRLEDRVTGGGWRARRATITLVRGTAGIVGNGGLTLDLANGGTIPVEATIQHRSDDATTSFSVRFAGLHPPAVADLFPEAAPLAAVALPVDGRIDVTLDPRFRASRVAFDLGGGGGTVRLPALRPLDYRIASATLRGSVDLPAGRLAVDRLALRMDPGSGVGPMTVEASGWAKDGADALSAVLDMTVAAGGRTATISVNAKPREGGGTRVTAGFGQVAPPAFAPLATVLDPLREIALPIGGTVVADLDRDHRPESVRANLEGGAGRLVVPELFPQPVPVSGLTLNAQASLADRRVRVEQFAVDLGGPRVEVAGSVEDGPERLVAEVTATAHRMPLDDLHRFWPPGVGRNARDWITGNVEAGVVETATVTVAGSAPAGDPGAFTPSHLHGSLSATDVTVHYLRPLPPVVGIERVEGTIDGTTFTILTSGGHLDDVRAGDGKIVIINVGTPREDVTVDLPLRGPARTVLTVLDRPPLGYPSKLDLDPARSAGTVEAQLHFGFPLFQSLAVEDIDVAVQAKLEGAALKEVALGQDVTEGKLDLDLTTKAMTVKGRVRFAGVPVSVDWTERFDDAPKTPRTRIAVKGEADAADLARFGIDAGAYAQGRIGADVLFTIDQARQSAAAVTLDLAATRLSLAPLGWTKPAGTPARARAVFRLDKGKLNRITGLSLDGGGLKAAATVDIDPRSGAVRAVRDATLSVGRTDARATVEREGKGYIISLSGRSLDLKPVLADDSDGSGDDLPPIDVAVSLDRVLVGDGRPLEQVSGRVVFDGTLSTALLTARTGPAGAVTFNYVPEGGGRLMRLTAADAGAVLDALDITNRVRGGTLTVEGRAASRQRGAPLEGSIEIYDYTVLDAPAIARLINAMSLGGLAELLGSKGITFGRLLGTFRKTGDTLALHEVRTSGSALGLTLEGEIDMATDAAKLRGTIVPVYGLNRIIGQIPILGDVLSGGEGQGIFAATWHLDGPLADPSVSVNPLAVLAPGFLRNLFFLSDGAATPPEAGPPAWPSDRVN